MRQYIWIAAVLNCLVNFFLLLGTSRVTQRPCHMGRILLASALGGGLCGVCMVPGFGFLGNTLWRIAIMLVICVVAFGFRADALQPMGVFVLLQLALTGIAAGLDTKGIWSVLAAVGGLTLLYVVAFYNRVGEGSLVPVVLTHGQDSIVFTALRDTGNTLRDPVTGQAVLVVGAEVAQRLTGLTREQLHKPIEVMSTNEIPGLRLIPYHTIANPSGLLLAMRISKVRIGHWTGSTLVAFAPEGLGMDTPYQALTGGAAG